MIDNTTGFIGWVTVNYPNSVEIETLDPRSGYYSYRIAWKVDVERLSNTK